MKYCVHVYPRPYEYDDIEANTPEDAEDIVIRRYFPSATYEDILSVEVLWQCKECGSDNDLKSTTCEHCDDLCAKCGSEYKDSYESLCYDCQMKS